MECVAIFVAHASVSGDNQHGHRVAQLGVIQAHVRVMNFRVQRRSRIDLQQNFDYGPQGQLAVQKNRNNSCA